ncbi:MGH1-like glycoside hydrolase domain-containing protein [Streptomyces sp. WMMC905]|uniref:MGH1-like glycoside hydrolase domain-containing protein n=1 Tax=Streptomyces sp. WMMC905 TaxID=3404123 RepID=UPI003B93239C
MDSTARLTDRHTGTRPTTTPPGRSGVPPAAAFPPGPGRRRRAARVLADNWTGASTVPSRRLYPHQWSWDSAFIAIGLRHVSPLRAQTELETLLAAQWGDGRVPHIVFDPAVPDGSYFPGPGFWRSAAAGRAAGAPTGQRTSGIVQPPVHALAAWLVHRADPELSRARGFLARAHPRLAAWHRYLLRHRDLGGGSLAAVVHPWEQGMDNSPCWDAPLARVTPAPAHTFRRADLDHGAAPDRPTDRDYGRYVRLATHYRDGGYRDGHRRARARGFAVEDPAFNALLIASEHALGHIADSLGLSGARRHARAERLTAALVERLWDPAAGQFRCRDLVGGHLIGERGVSGLVPLVLPTLPRPVVGALVRTLTGPHFGVGATTRLPPSYDLLGDSFDPRRYWRGPAWFNTAWLLERGLRAHGERERADTLRTAVVELADSSGYAEYLHPRTEEPHGASGFGWTAALALDLTHDEGASDEPGAAETDGGAR